ncbi:related to Nucleoside transporter FUN26 [Saccharomycodes ludwigii]|uniref:Related to Nucleoside transporter FUN26 n=1 Tax=Saccharomycodes ludwigii TaxID=36035 RepID=A0A376BAT7_9ASCO|nr:hypothetical protein SCDLUD_000479 [Saccharomycodes ludwigii]KAH3902884.1 hypothetical protein SCDLUD_000479 [Saccharomycodes ludwigii]SSD61260.1 related to Nucleoside transporter FUN26 [Saccharomycodes ludwigii]
MEPGHIIEGGENNYIISHSDEDTTSKIVDDIENNKATIKIAFKEPYDIKYITFVLIGVALLWPWNSFLSASLFFQHDIFNDNTIWAKTYTSTMMSFSTVSSVLTNFYLSRRQYGYSSRVKKGLIWQIVVFTILSISILLISGKGNDSDKKSSIFYCFTFIMIMTLVLVSSVGTALTQNGSMAWANVYGSEIYSQAVMLGQALAGVLPSLVLFFISFIKATNDPRDQNVFGIFGYFINTAIISIAALILFQKSKIGVSIPKLDTEETELILNENNELTNNNDTNNSLIHQTTTDNLNNASNSNNSHRGNNNTTNNNIPLKIIYSKLKFLVWAIFITFSITLMVFPVFAANTLVTKLPIGNAQFIPLAFTIWNIGDLYGRYISNKFKLFVEKFQPIHILIYSLLRILIVPFFFSCNIFGHLNNKENNGGSFNDFWYLFLQFIFGVTNGNSISLCFMKVGDQLNSDDERKAAGGFTNIFLSVGLTVGSFASYLFVFCIGKLYKE